MIDITDKILANLEILKDAIKANNLDLIVEQQLKLSVLNTEYGQEIAKAYVEVGNAEAYRELEKSKQYTDLILMGYKNSPAESQARISIAEHTAKLAQAEMNLRSMKVLSDNIKDTVTSAQSYLSFAKMKATERI